MKVTRSICIYDKHNDKYLDEIGIDNISLDILKEIINADADDPDLYKIHPITKTQYERIIVLVPSLSNYDLKKVDRFFECCQA